MLRMTLVQVEDALKLAEENNLLKTAGSDFHREKDCLGHVNYGSIKIEDNTVSKEILEHRR